MNTVDIILSLILLYGLVRGFFRGLLSEVASLVGIIAGIYGAIHFSHFLAEVLTNYVDWAPRYLNLISFAVTFILIVFLVSLAGKLLTQMAGFVALGIVNKLLGAVFGIIKTAFIASVIIMFFKATNEKIDIIAEESFENSILYEPVAVIAPILLPSIIKEVEDQHLLEEDPEKYEQ